MAALNALSDTELLRLLKEGDQSAFSQIYDRYWAVLYRYARRLLQDDQSAQDVVQDIFVMLWSKSVDLEVKTSLSSFLYASVRNKILKLFERDKVHSKYLVSLEDFIAKGTNITDDTLRERELAARIELEVGLLPTKMREIFLLSRTEHLSYKEIAEQLDISEHTVKKQVHNATKALRLKLGSLLPVALVLLNMKPPRL